MTPPGGFPPGDRAEAEGAPRSGRLRATWIGLLAGGAATCAAWLATVLDHSPPLVAARLVVLATLAAGAAAAGAEIARLVRGRGSVSSVAGRWLLAILAVSLLSCLVGLGHEATGRDYGDEGIYLANAQRVNDGWILRPNFIYPHLLYHLDAMALWIAGLFPGATAAVATAWGVEGELATATLVCRFVTALLGALVVLPVFAIGRRLAGERAGLFGAALIAVSPLWTFHAHLNLSDVAGAVFATFCVAAVAALLHEECAGLYVVAGATAGLAAGGKYPAGVVAVAIVAAWIRWRWRTRRWSWGLVVAGGAALAVFLLTTPSLLAFPEAVVRGEGTKDLLFGVRQYATRGWTGVVHASNSLYYGEQLVRALGLPALVLGLAGTVGLGGEERRRLAWILVFPAIHLLLLVRMEMAVPRNLLPTLPVLAGVAGCGLAGLVRSTVRRVGAPLVPIAAGVAALALVGPAWATVREVVPLARPTTRELAVRWLQESLPPGSFLVREAYTPPLRPPLFSRKPRFVSRLPPEVLRDPTHDFVLLASRAHSRFLEPRNLEQPRYAYHAERYREIFETFPLVKEFRPGPWRAGPVLQLHRVDPSPVAYRNRGRWAANDATVPREAMRTESGLRFRSPEDWALYKAHLAAGTYRVAARGALDGGRVLLRDRGNRILDDMRLDAAGRARVRVPRDDKVFLYVHARPGSRLAGVTIERREPDR